MIVIEVTVIEVTVATVSKSNNYSLLTDQPPSLRFTINKSCLFGYVLAISNNLNTYEVMYDSNCVNR